MRRDTQRSHQGRGGAWMPRKVAVVLGLLLAGLGFGSMTGTASAAERTDSTTSLTSSPNPSVWGDKVDFVATVTPVNGGPVPTGTIDIYIDGDFDLDWQLGNGMAFFYAATLQPGTHTIQVLYSGNSLYNPSESAVITQVVAPADQVITFPDPGPHQVGDSFTVSATSSSHLTVRFRVPDGGPCTIVGRTVTITGTGSCVITAYQDGNSQYHPAAPVDRVVTITNSPPVANGDGYTVDEDGALSVAAPGVLANDTDPEGSALSASLTTVVQHGTLSLSPDGSFTYAPAPDFHGGDSFTYTAGDPGGLSSAPATVSLTVVHVDDIPPTLHLPAPITVDATGTTGGAAVSYTATASDENPLSPAVTCTPASGSTFAIGTTTVNCTASDAAGNTASGSFTVTVSDVLPPALTLPAGVTVDATGTTGGAAVSYTATASDDNPASPHPAVTCTPASGSTFAIGTTTVNCTATDAAGHTASGSFPVTVKDVLPPALTLPAPITVDATGPSGAPVTFTASATDDDRRNPTPTVTCTPAPGSTFAVGDTTVTCTATDPSGNVASGTVTVHVEGAAEQIVDLVAASQGVGPGGAVAGKIEKAQSELAAGKVDKACKSVDDYIKQVQVHTPKKITPALAAVLIADATRLQNVMGC